MFLRIRVSDNGHGMTPDQLERIFDPYYTTKDTGEGTGLGLAVVRGIIKAHGGVVTVESQPNEGSIFDIYLPEVEADVSDPAEKPGALPTGHETILFVDDEQSLVSMSKQMLELMGYRTIVRTSSIEAYELFRHDPHRFDLVITDMTMPNMTGAQLAGKLLKIRPDIPVILCTGYSEQITEKRAKEIGVRAFVLKPLVMREIAETIRAVLDSAPADS